MQGSEAYFGRGDNLIKMIVSVFGCSGFLGRYVVGALLKRGATVIVPFRGDDVEVRHLKVMGDLGQVIPMVSACVCVFNC